MSYESLSGAGPSDEPLIELFSMVPEPPLPASRFSFLSDASVAGALTPAIPPDRALPECNPDHPGRRTRSTLRV